MFLQLRGAQHVHVEVCVAQPGRSVLEVLHVGKERDRPAREQAACHFCSMIDVKV